MLQYRRIALKVKIYYSYNYDIQSKEQVVNFLTSKDLLPPSNHITMQTLTHSNTDQYHIMMDAAALYIANDITAAVKLQLQEHLESFNSNVENMRDAVEHVTVAAKEFTGKMNDFNDGFHDSAEHLAQATQELSTNFWYSADPPNSSIPLRTCKNISS